MNWNFRVNYTSYLDSRAGRTARGFGRRWWINEVASWWWCTARFCIVGKLGLGVVGAGRGREVTEDGVSQKSSSLELRLVLLFGDTVLLEAT